MSEISKKHLITAFKSYFFITPFLFCLGNSGSPFELIKLLALVTFASCAALAAALYAAKLSETQIRWNPALMILASGLALNFVSYLFSVDRYLSFWGDDQIPADSLLSVLAVFTFCFIAVQAQPNRNDIVGFLKVIVFNTSLLATHGLLQYFGFAQFHELSIFDDTLVATIGQPVILTNILVCTIPLFIFLILNEKNKFVRALLAAGFLMTEAVVFLAESRTPWLLNLTLLVIYSVTLAYRHKGRLGLRMMSSLALLFTVFIVWQLYSPLNSRLDEKLSSNALQKGFQARMIVWRDGLTSLKDHPFIGSGPETFGIEQKKNQSLELNLNEYWKTYWAKAHNSVVHVAVSTGLIGLLLYLSAYFYMGIRLIKRTRPGGDSAENGLLFSLAFSALLIFLCNLTSFNYIQTQTYSAFLFVLFVLIDSHRNRILKIRINFLNRIGLWAFVFFQALLIAAVFSYWYSNLLLQKSYKQITSQSDADEALELASQALRLNTGNALVYCHRSNVLLHILLTTRSQLPKEQIDNLLRDINQESQTCVEKAPNRYLSHLGRGRAYSVLFQQGLVPDSSVAEASFLEFHRLAPHHPGPYFENAVLDLRNQKVGDFIEKMQTVIQLKADFLPAYTQLIKYYFTSNQPEKNDALVARILATEFTSGEFVPEIKSVAALCQSNGKQNLADQLNQFYEQKKYLIQRTY